MRRGWPIPWNRQEDQGRLGPNPSATRPASLAPTRQPEPEHFAHMRKISVSIPPRPFLLCQRTRENGSEPLEVERMAAPLASLVFVSSASLPHHPAASRALRKCPACPVIRSQCECALEPATAAWFHSSLRAAPGQSPPDRYHLRHFEYASHRPRIVLRDLP